ncbi:MAG: two-component sensor histidine kinase, partial [Stackebrandtia sp.]
MRYRRRPSLATRVTVLCLLVALVTVVVTGVVAGRLITSTATKVNQATLSEQADGVAEVIKSEDYDRPKLGIPRIIKALRGQDVSIVVRYPDGEFRESDPVPQ